MADILHDKYIMEKEEVIPSGTPSLEDVEKNKTSHDLEIDRIIDQISKNELPLALESIINNW